MLDDFAPSLVMVKENFYVRPDNVDYCSFVVKDEEAQTGDVQILYTNGNGITITDVAQKDFKRIADTANWYFNQQESAQKA